MGKENQEQSNHNKQLSKVPEWYYMAIFALVILSLITIKRDVTAGKWEIAVGIREITSVLVGLALLPVLLGFIFRHVDKGNLKMPGGPELSWDNRKREIDQEIAEKQKRHERAGEAARKPTMELGDIGEIRDADTELRDAIPAQELPIAQQTYLRELDKLIKDFNRNRHLRPSWESTAQEGDKIAYKMRAMAPLLSGQLDIPGWLASNNLGKHLAAIKYLDWAQDIEFADVLSSQLAELESKGDIFQPFHILLALLSMADQLAYDLKDTVKKALEDYIPKRGAASAREHLRDQILRILS